MKVELENVKPMEIEKRSFEIITEELGDKQLVPGSSKDVSIQVQILIMQKTSAFLKESYSAHLRRSKQEPV